MFIIFANNATKASTKGFQVPLPLTPCLWPHRHSPADPGGRGGAWHVDAEELEEAPAPSGPLRRSGGALDLLKSLGLEFIAFSSELILLKKRLITNRQFSILNLFFEFSKDIFLGDFIWLGMGVSCWDEWLNRLSVFTMISDY